IKYEEVQLSGKSQKRVLNVDDITALKPFHWGYHFDKVLARGGFDAIITNPPWEIFKPQAKEFFAQHNELVTKNKMDIKAFEKEQKKLLQNPETAEAWLEYQSQYPYVSAYYRSSENYKNQISIVNGKKAGTDINLYKLFVERCFHLLRDAGECGIVIPSGIYTDLGTKQLREMLFSQTKVTGLFCLENRKTIFEEVDSRFKFVVLTFVKGGITTEFPSAFMRHDVQELERFPSKESLEINVDMVRRLSPDSLSVMEFKNEIDIRIAEKMTQFPLLGEKIDGKWNLVLCNEFHMTNDSHLFKQQPAKGRLPLYEGKMIHQFTHQFAEPRYWVDENEGRKAVLGRNGSDKGQKLDYQNYRLGFRDVASSTNQRTMIAGIVPFNVFAGNTLIVSEAFIKSKELLFVCAVLNSFACDFVIRQKVTAHCNMFFVYQLPIPRLTESDRYFSDIVQRAAKLICTTPEFDELAQAVGLGSHANGVTDETERAKLRAELDGMIAHLYGLTAAEFEYILSTFPIVSEQVKQDALAAYRNIDLNFS
ncbi:MAG: Eco57I restriction-modification methylase domain-containing protein, partial [Gloeotrichia echinulata HAB0833]